LLFLKKYRERYDKPTTEKILRFLGEKELKADAWILINKDDVEKEEMIGWLYFKDKYLKVDISDIEETKDAQDIKLNLSVVPPLQILIKKMLEDVESSGTMSLQEFKERLGVEIRAA